MYPILFTIGKVSIPTYTVLLDLGLILALVLTYFEGKRQLESAEMALDIGLWTVIGGILGGRIGYVVANASTFSENWSRVVRLWEGGLSFHGAFLGGLVVLLLLALLQRRREKPVSFWKLGDVVTTGLALGLVFGWAACLLGGCAYGVLGQGFGYMLLPDIYGLAGSRFATQIAGLIQAAILFIAFWLMRKRWPFTGAAFLMFNLLYFTGQFFLEFVRGDEAIYLGPWRLPQALDLLLALLAATALLWLWWQSRSGVAEIEEVEGVGEAEGAEELEETLEIETAQESDEDTGSEGGEASNMSEGTAEPEEPR